MIVPLSKWIRHNNLVVFWLLDKLLAFNVSTCPRFIVENMKMPRRKCLYAVVVAAAVVTVAAVVVRITLVVVVVVQDTSVH